MSRLSLYFVPLKVDADKCKFLLDSMTQGCYLYVRTNTQTITKDGGYKTDAFTNRK